MSDFDFDQDDFFEDYEEEKAGADDLDKSKNDKEVLETLSPAEQERRVAAFQKEQQRNMQIIVKPKQYKPDQRKEAVRWLGEAGDPTAVPALLKVYQKDKTPGMKEEAEYALAQIKAMGRALEDPEMEAQAYELLNNIVLHKKFGKRVDTSRFQLIEIGLGVSAILITVIGVFAMLFVAIPKQNEQATEIAKTHAYETEVAPTWTPDVEDAVKGDLERYYTQLLSDTNAYNFELLKAGRGESINCDEDFLFTPSSYELTPNWADNATYSAITDALNEIRTTLSPVRVAYRNSCNTLTAITREETLSLANSVVEAQRLLSAAESLLGDSGLQAQELEFASPTPPPTDVPEPSATPDITDAEDTIIQLERLITDMVGQRGVANSIVLYWEQVISGGQMYREGCNLGELSIPPDFALPEDLQGAFSSLDLAVQNVNVGLLTLRQASTAFFTACAEGAVPANAGDRLAQANLAKNAFTAAQAELSKLANQ